MKAISLGCVLIDHTLRVVKKNKLRNESHLIEEETYPINQTQLGEALGV